MEDALELRNLKLKRTRLQRAVCQGDSVDGAIPDTEPSQWRPPMGGQPGPISHYVQEMSDAISTGFLLGGGGGLIELDCGILFQVLLML